MFKKKSGKKKDPNAPKKEKKEKAFQALSADRQRNVEIGLKRFKHYSFDELKAMLIHMDPRLKMEDYEILHKLAPQSHEVKQVAEFRKLQKSNPEKYGDINKQACCCACCL